MAGILVGLGVAPGWSAPSKGPGSGKLLDKEIRKLDSDEHSSREEGRKAIEEELRRLGRTGNRDEQDAFLDELKKTASTGSVGTRTALESIIQRFLTDAVWIRRAEKTSSTVTSALALKNRVCLGGGKAIAGGWMACVEAQDGTIVWERNDLLSPVQAIHLLPEGLLVHTVGAEAPPQAAGNKRRNGNWKPGSVPVAIGSIGLCDPKTGGKTWSLSQIELPGTPGSVVPFPNGAILTGGSARDAKSDGGWLALLKRADGKTIWSVTEGLPGPVEVVAGTSDGRVLAGGNAADGAWIVLCDPKKPGFVWEKRDGLPGKITHLTAGPEGVLAAGPGLERTGAWVGLFSDRTGKSVWDMSEERMRLNSVAFGVDTVAVGGAWFEDPVDFMTPSSALKILDRKTGKLLCAYGPHEERGVMPGEVNAICPVQDGYLIGGQATCGKLITGWMGHYTSGGNKTAWAIAPGTMDPVKVLLTSSQGVLAGGMRVEIAEKQILPSISSWYGVFRADPSVGNGKKGRSYQ